MDTSFVRVQGNQSLHRISPTLLSFKNSCISFIFQHQPSPFSHPLTWDQRLSPSLLMVLESLLYPVQVNFPCGHQRNGALASLLHSDGEHMTSVDSIKDDVPHLLWKVHLPDLSFLPVTLSFFVVINTLWAPSYCLDFHFITENTHSSMDNIATFFRLCNPTLDHSPANPPQILMS